MSKHFLIVIFVLSSSFSFLFSQKTTIYDTPTALTLEQGEFQTSTFFYADNSFLLKFGIGAHRIINLGVSEYVDNLLGNRKMKWSIPNAFVKIRFTDLPDDSHNFAIGFDSFYNGSLNPFDEKIYGVYLVYTLGFNFGNEYISGPQLFSVGVRYPLIYEKGDINIFASIFFNLFTYFNFGFEISNIHFADQYKYNFILNSIFTFKISEEFQISLNFQLGLLDGSDDKFDSSRDLRLVYRNFF